MSKINNQEVIHRIADKTRKASKGRNLVILLAIVLTTLLFTSVFTVSGSIVTKLQEETMRQVGGSAHAGYKYLTQEEYDILAKDPWIKEISYRISVGTVANEALRKQYTEVSYYEELDARFSFCYPEVGKMPEAENEIVTSDFVLKALGYPTEIGTKIPLVLDIGGEPVEEEFVLSGYFKGDSVSMAQVLLVSKAYQEKYAPVQKESVAEWGILSEEQYVGRIMADVNFFFDFALDGQLALLTKRCGFPESIPVGVNWAYVGSELDPGAVGVFFIFIVLIIMAGYLIIYNVFYINVYADIRHYGLLKTIGTTGAQLKRIVKRQAYILSLIGIPIGLVLGAMVGKVLLPYVMGEFSFHTSADTEVELNAGIFIGAVLFSFFTIYISCIKPCKEAAKVTPMEALRATEGNVTAKKGKKTRAVNPRQMAAQNLKRNRKKVVVVIASLSLALVLLNSVYGMISSFDMDKFTAQRIVSDFSIADVSLDNVSVSADTRVTDGVTAQFLEELTKQEGVEEVAHIYFGEFGWGQRFTDSDWEKVVERVLKSPVVMQAMERDAEQSLRLSGEEVTPEKLKEYEEWYLDGICQRKYLSGKIYGVDKLAMEHLEEVEGELDWEKFKTGKYVITTRELMYGNVNYFYPGEKITIFNEAGEAKEYEVMAVADMPYACEFQVYTDFNCCYILPSVEFLEFVEEKQPMRTLVDVSDASEEAVEAWLANYCENINPDLDYLSKAKMVEEFEGLKQTFGLVGGVLVVILALIGILNFTNTMITSILARKQELAMLEAVGMSGRQQKEMLIWEGLYYAGWTIMISALLGILLNVTGIRALSEVLFFTTWQFTITPILLCIPVILLVVVAVPLICYRILKKVSVVERIRSIG